VECPRLVHSALGDQNIEVKVKIDPVIEPLDDGDDTECMCAPVRASK